jgi:hypothetical protein
MATKPKTKRPNIFAEAEAIAAPAIEAATPATDKPTRKSEVRPDRVGKRGKLFYMVEAAEKQLSILAIEKDTTQQALLTEAVNDLFRKYKRDAIA